MHKFVLRPAQQSDLDAIETMALLAQAGMTSLPKDRALLRKKIHLSERSFQKEVTTPANETYFFVLEDLLDHQVVGVCSILASIGCDEPFYAYSIQTIKKNAWCFGQEHSIKILKLTLTHNGSTEIGSLYLRPDYRKYGIGKLLSLSRFLFIKGHTERFQDTVIAEMRGVSDANGKSPFWNAIGLKFFNIPFQEADKLSAQSKDFIAQLMPKYPIYINLLDAEAQKVIGQAHPKTVPALNMLLQQGFQPTQSVDIFDAGPKISCPTHQIKTIQNAQHVTLQSVPALPQDAAYYLVCAGQLLNFRCMHIQGLLERDTLYIASEDAHYLFSHTVTTAFVVPLAKKSRHKLHILERIRQGLFKGNAQ